MTMASKRKIDQKENIPPKKDAESKPSVSVSSKNNNQLDDEMKNRLEYLLKQAEILSDLVTNGSESTKDTIDDKRNALAAASDDSSNKKRRKLANGKATKADKKVKTNLMRYDKTPDYIDAKMHDYQIDGLNWLIALVENRIGGILGDEMGLGKTIQTISILGYLKNVQKINGPFLVVTPLTTVENWLNEVNRFCPSLDAFILYGTKDVRFKLLNKMKSTDRDWDVCITSYETCRVAKNPMQRIKWNFVVLDEGHKIKNEEAQINKALRSIKSDHRLMLTGTPLNNDLHELWVLLNYLVPNIFANAHDFDTWFDSDDCLRGNDEVVKCLHAVLKPIMLRRVKADVLTSLLPKKEIKLYIGMSPLQRETYKKVLLKQIETVDALGSISFKHITSIVTELRKTANHPYLISGIEPGPPYTTDQHLVDSCGKMIVLDQLLSKLKSQGSRVVLFSQFVIVLNIIEDYLEWKGYNFLRLDGSVKIAQRATDITSFNAGNSDTFIFLISTRAGGLGINLATADTVIIYDSDWNPQSDFQAIDRVHRIGQKKQVYVYRLISENTIDHRIVQRAEIKQRLDKLVIKHGQTHVKEEKEGKEQMIDAIKYAFNEIAKDEKNIYEANFDLENIFKESAAKAAAEKETLDKMTLEDSSSGSVYIFEGSDFRDNQQKSMPKP